MPVVQPKCGLQRKSCLYSAWLPSDLTSLSCLVLKSLLFIFNFLAILLLILLDFSSLWLVSSFPFMSCYSNVFTTGSSLKFLLLVSALLENVYAFPVCTFVLNYLALLRMPWSLDMVRADELNVSTYSCCAHWVCHESSPCVWGLSVESPVVALHCAMRKMSVHWGHTKGSLCWSHWPSHY